MQFFSVKPRKQTKNCDNISQGPNKISAAIGAYMRNRRQTDDTRTQHCSISTTAIMVG